MNIYKPICSKKLLIMWTTYRGKIYLNLFNKIYIWTFTSIIKLKLINCIKFWEKYFNTKIINIINLSY